MIKGIIAGIMFMVAIGLVFGIVRPTYNETLAISEQSAQYAEGLSKAREVAQLRTALIQKYNILPQENVARLHKLLPDHVDNVRLILDIDGIAKRNNLTIGSVSARKETEKSDAQRGSIGIQSAEQEQQRYKSVVLEFSVVSTYAEFVNFMRELEQSLRIVDLVDLSMGPAEKNTILSTPVELQGLAQTSNALSQSSVNPLYKFTVAIRTYWLP
jgi:Tfp pilus assembly protein PilO